MIELVNGRMNKLTWIDMWRKERREEGFPRWKVLSMSRGNMWVGTIVDFYD